jgi:hypothetical protein
MIQLILHQKQRVQGSCKRPSRLTCLSPGKKTMLIADPHSMVRIQAVLLAFQILSVPLAALAMTLSSDETATHRTSFRCPGSSIEWVLVGSVGASSVGADFLVRLGEGRRYVSIALLDRAIMSCTRQLV